MEAMPVAHLLGVAHSITSHERGAHANPTDAFVNCTIYMAKLLHRAGWTVYVYAVEGSVVPECTEVVAVVSRVTYDATYAPRDDQMLNTFSDCSVATWVEFGRRCPEAVRARRQDAFDFVLPMFGAAHEPTTRALAMPAVVEPCIGHPGAYAPFRVYCSYAWMYTDLAARSGGHNAHGHAYWSVIPHFVPPEDYPLCEHREPFAVYLGRVQHDKGVAMAVDATREAGMRLKVIGNGRLEDLLGEVPPHVDVLGVLSLHDKVQWLQRAQCVFVPTLYIEPFSFACLEAQMCGTPVLCTRWGGPAEIVRHGRTGYHCDTLQTFVHALRACAALSPLEIRHHAIRRFGVAAITPYFEAYLAKVGRLVRGQEDYYSVMDEPPPAHAMGVLADALALGG